MPSITFACPFCCESPSDSCLGPYEECCFSSESLLDVTIDYTGGTTCPATGPLSVTDLPITQTWDTGFPGTGDSAVRWSKTVGTVTWTITYSAGGALASPNWEFDYVDSSSGCTLYANVQFSDSTDTEPVNCCGADGAFVNLEIEGFFNGPGSGTLTITVKDNTCCKDTDSTCLKDTPSNCWGGCCPLDGSDCEFCLADGTPSQVTLEVKADVIDNCGCIEDFTDHGGGPCPEGAQYELTILSGLTTGDKHLLTQDTACRFTGSVAAAVGVNEYEIDTGVPETDSESVGPRPDCEDVFGTENTVFVDSYTLDMLFSLDKIDDDTWVLTVYTTRAPYTEDVFVLFCGTVTVSPTKDCEETYTIVNTTECNRHQETGDACYEAILNELRGGGPGFDDNENSIEAAEDGEIDILCGDQTA